MIIQEVWRLSHSYVRKGGRANRKLQRKRMLAFAEFCAGEGAQSLGQVGDRHVIRYWRATADLSDTTRYNHWLALRILWRLAGKPKEPPAPRLLQAPSESASKE